MSQDERVWTPIRLDDSHIDFCEILGQPSDYRLAYAVTYLASDKNQSGLVMKVGSDDQAKILLNGRQIYRQTEGRIWEPDTDVVTGVELKAGINVLLFKVVNGTGGWGGSIRFTDAAGQSVKGIRVSLTPL